MQKPDCLGILFLHTDHHCVGDKNRPACPAAAECATLCEKGPSVVGDMPTWSDLNKACVEARYSKSGFDLGLIDVVLPELVRALEGSNENVSH